MNKLISSSFKMATKWIWKKNRLKKVDKLATENCLNVLIFFSLQSEFPMNYKYSYRCTVFFSIQITGKDYACNFIDADAQIDVGIIFEHPQNVQSALIFPMNPLGNLGRSPPQLMSFNLNRICSAKKKKYFFFNSLNDLKEILFFGRSPFMVLKLVKLSCSSTAQHRKENPWAIMISLTCAVN